MAYTSAYQYDIFISYAHDDNDASMDEKDGWVSQFKTYFEWQAKRRGLKNLNIWFDDQLKGNTTFDTAIQDSIINSALFFVLHSNNYQGSDYCRKELHWFLEQNNKSPQGVIVGDESRIFNILINNIHHSKWPDDLAGTSGFTLHDAQQETDYGYPVSTKHEQFKQEMQKLAEATASILDKIQPEPEANTEDKKEDGKPKIFIADAADSLQLFRKRLINEIGDKAIIQPSLPPPYEAVEHQTKLNQILDESSLTIHLLDQYAGRQIDELENTSFSRLQTETAINQNPQSLVWVPDTLKAEDIEDEQQAKWLQQLESGSRNIASDFKFVRSNKQSFIEQVSQLIEELQQNKTENSQEDSTFLIDTHPKDQYYAYQLAAMLASKKVNVGFNQESHDPVQSLENFEQAVKRVQNLIIMFGGVDPAWTKGRIQKTIKIVASQLGEGDSVLDAIWVFMLPSCPGKSSIGEFPRLLKINYLDNSSSDTIDENVIHSLLNPNKGEG